MCCVKFPARRNQRSHTSQLKQIRKLVTQWVNVCKNLLECAFALFDDLPLGLRSSSFFARLPVKRIDLKIVQ